MKHIKQKIKDLVCNYELTDNELIFELTELYRNKRGKGRNKYFIIGWLIAFSGWFVAFYFVNL